MRHYYSVDAIRRAEAPLLASLPDGALMRRAAFGLAAEIVAELRARTGGVAGRRVCAVVGSGDNGGDALWAATFVRRRGAAADAVLLNPEHSHRKGLAAFLKAGGRIVESVSPTTDLVIDGVVGISGSGPLRPAAAEVFASVDDAGIPVVAVDIPSGIDVATGAITGPAVHAALTVTFGGLKPVHALGDCGRVKLVDIGLDLPDTDVLGFEAADAAARWPVPGPHDDKYTQGVTGVMAGSSTYPGAAVLCTGAAVAATSGMVRYAGSAHREVLAHWPEVIAAPTPASAGRVQAWVVGPGLGTDDTGAAALWFALETDLPVIVDADGLTILAAHPDLVVNRSAPTVLTPHAGEFARLAGYPPGGRSGRRMPQARRRVWRHRAAQGQCHGHRRSRRPGLPQPGRAVLGGHRRVRRCALRDDRRAAGLGACRPARRPRPRPSCTPTRRRCRPPTRAPARRRRRRRGSSRTSEPPWPPSSP